MLAKLNQWFQTSKLESLRLTKYVPYSRKSGAQIRHCQLRGSGTNQGDGQRDEHTVEQFGTRILMLSPKKK